MASRWITAISASSGGWIHARQLSEDRKEKCCVSFLDVAGFLQVTDALVMLLDLFAVPAPSRG